MLEGRLWMQLAADKFNAKRVAHPKEGKHYIYQLYTTAYVEFETLEELHNCKEWLDKNDRYWNYDPVKIFSGLERK